MCHSSEETLLISPFWFHWIYIDKKSGLFALLHTTSCSDYTSFSGSLPAYLPPPFRINSVLNRAVLVSTYRPLGNLLESNRTGLNLSSHPQLQFQNVTVMGTCFIYKRRTRVDVMGRSIRWAGFHGVLGSIDLTTN